MAEDEFSAVETASAKLVDESVPLVLVTGATGFVATHVTKLLLLAGNCRVRGTIRNLKSEEKVKALKNLVPDAKYPLDLCEANLLDKECWAAAVNGCTYVYHIASPFILNAPKNPDELIGPAVEGTKNVLSACADSGSVKRVVVTSSIAAVSCGPAGHPNRASNVYTEEDWSPEKGCPPYERSKVLAERAAWDFVKELPDEKKFELVVVNPGFIQGPVLTAASGTSIDFAKNILIGKISAAPDVCFPIVDVRDVAQAELVAMEKPECNGNRYILVADSSVPVRQIQQVFADEFRPQGYKIGTGHVPKIIAWFGSFVVPDLKSVYPLIGKKLQLSNDKMINELGIQPRDVKTTLLDAAYSLIDFGMVNKTPQFYGPGGKPKPPPDDDVKEDNKVETEDQPKETDPVEKEDAPADVKEDTPADVKEDDKVETEVQPKETDEPDPVGKQDGPQGEVKEEETPAEENVDENPEVVTKEEEPKLQNEAEKSSD